MMNIRKILFILNESESKHHTAHSIGQYTDDCLTALCKLTVPIYS